MNRGNEKLWRQAIKEMRNQGNEEMRNKELRN